jgi:hypothetical protein
VNNILTELLQHAANFREVIGIGFVFRALRQCLTSQGTRKERNEGYARSLFVPLIVHLAFSFHILVLVWITNRSRRSGSRSRHLLFNRLSLM